MVSEVRKGTEWYQWFRKGVKGFRGLHRSWLLIHPNLHIHTYNDEHCIMIHYDT
jgi:hypothetical protein